MYEAAECAGHRGTGERRRVGRQRAEHRRQQFACAPLRSNFDRAPSQVRYVDTRETVTNKSEMKKKKTKTEMIRTAAGAQQRRRRLDRRAIGRRRRLCRRRWHRFVLDLCAQLSLLLLLLLLVLQMMLTRAQLYRRDTQQWLNIMSFAK